MVYNNLALYQKFGLYMTEGFVLKKDFTDRYRFTFYNHMKF